MGWSACFAEEVKIYSYIHVGKIHIHRMFPKGWTISKCFIHSGTHRTGEVPDY